MGGGNCAGCHCKKNQDEDELMLTEKNQANKNATDDIIVVPSPVKHINNNEREDNDINTNKPMLLLKEDIINLEGTKTISIKDNKVRNSIDSSSIQQNFDTFDNKQSKIRNLITNNDQNNPSNSMEVIEGSQGNDNPSVENNNETKENNIKNPVKSQNKDKINFGLINESDLTIEQKKLLSETQKNLNQFYPPQAIELKALRSKLKKIPLNSIVPEYKLISELPDDELLFNGELKKLINYEVSAHKPQLYSSRFCTLTRTTFRYFKSKEQYLTLNKPLCTVPFNQITKISFMKTKKTSKKIDHILICNKQGITKHKKDIIGSKIFEQHEQSALENNESLLIFTSEVEDFLYKWYLLIDFYITSLKK